MDENKVEWLVIILIKVWDDWSNESQDCFNSHFRLKQKKKRQMIGKMVGDGLIITNIAQLAIDIHSFSYSHLVMMMTF